MKNALGPDTILGYCTNVHAGADLAQMRANLERYALPVKQAVSPHAPMGVGLWFSARAARELIESQRVAELRDWLGEHGLLAYTLNGFPYGDFHEPVVKHRVYLPDWTTRERFDYTLDLVKILAQLLPDDAEEGSISTLPLGWPSQMLDGAHSAAAKRLMDLVHALARSELDTGKLIHVDLEPEPGCALDTAEDVVRFFEDHLLGTPDDESVRAYLRVCHDVCHSAVMFEPQAEALAAYRGAGIRVGKVQVSAAIGVDFSGIGAGQRRRAVFHALRQFDEPRYLHQTVIRGDGRPESGELYEDLSAAIAALGGREVPDGEWRVHFHVPIYLPEVGPITSTQACIGECLRAIRRQDEVHHFEVETYAWGVLPEELRVGDLADGIAREMRWLTDTHGSRLA